MTRGQQQQQQKNGSEYLQEVLGDILAKALSAVAKERPDDPIQYVADFLYSHKRKHEKEEESNNSNNHSNKGIHHHNSSSNNSNISSKNSSIESATSKYTNTSTDSNFTQNHSGGSKLGSVDSKSSRIARVRGRATRRSRKRTAQSEPVAPLLTTPPPEQEERRSRSLTTEERPYDKYDPRRLVSRRVPVAALPWEDYRVKRGLVHIRLLPPMSSTPSMMSELEDLRNISIDGKPKPGQLRPMEVVQHGEVGFDWEKHARRNERMLRENRMLANMQ